MKYTDWMSGKPVEKQWPRRTDWLAVFVVGGLVAIAAISVTLLVAVWVS